MRFIRILAISLLASLAFAQAGLAADNDPPQTTNLQADAKLAQKEKLPIMVVFTAENCPYCAALESDQLRPMMISGDYTHKVIIRRLMIDNFGDITYFDGKKIAADSLAQKLNVWVTPTIMFFDHDGHTLAPKIVGYTTPSMFGGFLDESIDKSLQMLHSELASNGQNKKQTL